MAYGLRGLIVRGLHSAFDETKKSWIAGGWNTTILSIT